jgi:cytochrome c nitrite reductase small subunit
MPRSAVLVGAVPVGLAVGIGAYTFAYTKGASDLTNDPRACVNCHVMREQYDGLDRRQPPRGGRVQ